MLWRLGWWDSPSDSCWCCSWCWMRHWGKCWQQLIDSWQLHCGYRWYLSPRNSKEYTGGTGGGATRPVGKLISVDHSQRRYQICPSFNTIWYSGDYNGQLGNSLTTMFSKFGVNMELFSHRLGFGLFRAFWQNHPSLRPLNLDDLKYQSFCFMMH